jgi:hypothetical protein
MPRPRLTGDPHHDFLTHLISSSGLNFFPVNWRRIAATVALDDEAANAKVGLFADAGYVSIPKEDFVQLTHSGLAHLKRKVAPGEVGVVESKTVSNTAQPIPPAVSQGKGIEVPPSNPTSARPIFISHSKKDVELVRAFIAMLTSSGVATPGDILCSSVPGMSLPKGKDFKQVISDELHGTKLVIQIITPNFWASAYCLCELGATWIQSTNNYPIIVPPMKFDELKAVLVNVGAASMASKSDLSDLRDEIGNVVKGTSTSSLFENQRDDFLAALPSLLKPVAVAKPTEAATPTAARAEPEPATSKVLSDKDAVKVIEMLISGDENEQFYRLVAAARKALDALPRVARAALFKNKHHQYWDASEFKFDEIQEAKEADFIVANDSGAYFTGNDPKMKKAKAALKDIDGFLADAPEKWTIEFEEKYEFRADVWNRQFWKQFFGHLSLLTS